MRRTGRSIQLLLCGLSRPALAAAKAAGHWLTTGLPLLAATPVAAAFLNLPVEAWGAAMAALGLATGCCRCSARWGRR